MLWIRQEFIFSPHVIDATVVFGHTPMRAVMLDLPYKIGIDTGLVYGGKLSCVEFTEGVPYQVAAGAREVKTQSIRRAETAKRFFAPSALAILIDSRWRRSSVG